ncbi:MAG: translation initiation factor IF-2 [Patescibacteria group bacterium]
MKKNNEKRPPIVTVLGHVDHGKTTLLDVLRKTNVASREAGGITQKIGASQITTKAGKKITFIDTPGHEIFSGMRKRGVKLADIAILVVAADDGVAPQTREAIKVINEAKIPFIVALTKIDLPTASTESTVGQLEKEGIFFEGRGGQTPKVELSAKSGQGIDSLLELIILLSEVSEIGASPDSALEAVVVETNKGKGGPLVNAVVRNGKIAFGDVVLSDGVSGKVKALTNDKGESIKEALPGDPVQILGFENLPGVGSLIIHSNKVVKSDEKTTTRTSIVVEKGQLAFIIKTENAGAMEAILASMPKDVVVVTSGIGDVSEGDVFTAKASGARVFTFESKIPSGVAKLAETEGVEVKAFRIVYEMFKEIEELVALGKENVLGRAEVVASFPFNNKKVAGSKISSGKIMKSTSLRLMRGEKELGMVKVISLRKGKDEVLEAKEGEECGILFVPQLDFEVGDVLLSIAK